jgi:hypothetical protein
MVDKAHMREAAPHIERAHRCLDMLGWLAVNKDKLSLDKRVPNYFNILIDEILTLQDILLTDNEYTERVAFGLEYVSRTRELAYSVTRNNDGETFYSIDGMLPHKEMKRNVLFSGRVHHHD